VLHGEGAGVEEAELVMQAVAARPGVILGVLGDVVERPPVGDADDLILVYAPSTEILAEIFSDDHHRVAEAHGLAIEPHVIPADRSTQEGDLAAEDLIGGQTVEILDPGDGLDAVATAMLHEIVLDFAGSSGADQDMGLNLVGEREGPPAVLALLLAALEQGVLADGSRELDGREAQGVWVVRLERKGSLRRLDGRRVDVKQFVPAPGEFTAELRDERVPPVIV